MTREEDWWIARDEDSGIASQGPSREEALSNLDEAIALSREAQQADTPGPKPDVLWFDSE